MIICFLDRFKTGICIIYLLTFHFYSFSQTKTLLEESRPLTPSAFQFLKFTDMPVGKYTGIANVSIPLYQIVEDGVNIPIQLNYHSGGIRVNEEASEVGLGWSMQFGSIVQIVNDLDDLDPAFTKVTADYVGSTVPSELPYRYNWPFNTSGSGSTLNVGQPQATFAFPIATGNYFPVNGSYEIREFLSNEYYDSEPDIFKANFMGHSITFIFDRTTGNVIKVMNGSGYYVQWMQNGTFEITAPDGVKYTFGLKNTATLATTATVTTSSNTYGVSNYVGPGATSATWVLTKITTKNKHVIDFNYNQSAPYSNFTQVSQSWKKVNETGVNTYYYQTQFKATSEVLPDTGPAGMLTTSYSDQSESKITPLSIIFPKGRLDFISSDRLDILGGKKVDRIQISSQEVVKNIILNYSYSNASNIGGNGFTYNNSLFGNTPFLRLKLNSVNTGAEGTYSFIYDEQQLPPKNSFAQDQWGFFNGNLSNNSLIPNPSQYQRSDLGNNGNNHSASLNYSKAETLIKMIYPTGGSVNFEYELNSFDNYWTPDYNSSSNTITSGNGLRIKSIVHRDQSEIAYQNHVYDYSGGKAILPVNLYRNYNTYILSGLSNEQMSGAPATAYVRSYFNEEYTSNGYYSASMLGSINGVGYDEVKDRLVNEQGQDLGYTITKFHNYPNTLPSNSVQYMSRIPIGVPAIENKNIPKTGLEKSISIYAQDNTIKKKTTMEYNNSPSSLYYGLRVSGYGSLYYAYNNNSMDTWSAQPQHMVAIYPIYDFTSMLVNSKDVDYFENDSLVTANTYNYNYYNLLRSTTKTSKGIVQVDYTYYVSDNLSSPSAISSILLGENRLSEIMSMGTTTSYTTNSYPYTVTGGTSKSYDYRQEGNLIVKSSESISKGPDVFSTTTFDRYDDKGNLLQFTESGKTTSLIWSYNKNYMVGLVENANYNTLETVLGSDNLINLANSTPTTQWATINFLSQLNNDSRTKAAHFSCYFYRPLVGLSSITDPKGMTTTYEYDQLFRLKAIKNRDGNIIKQFDYHYKQP